MNHTLYQLILISLLLVGFVLASVFLAAFRPNQWRRLASWDAVGWVLIVWLFYTRGLGVALLRFPQGTVPGFWDGFLSVGLLVVINVLLAIRVTSFLAFRTKDRQDRRDLHQAEADEARS